MDHIVRNMDSLEMDVGPILVAMGQRHFDPTKATFKPEHVDLFRRSVMDYLTDILRDSYFLRELGRAWKLAVHKDDVTTPTDDERETLVNGDDESADADEELEEKMNKNPTNDIGMDLSVVSKNTLAAWDIMIDYVTEKFRYGYQMQGLRYDRA